MLTWTPALDDQTLPETPASLLGSLKELIAYDLIVIWIELNCVDSLVSEIAESFNGVAPMRPVFREKMETTRQKLLTIKQKLLELHSMDVVFRNPLEEEVHHRRAWFEELLIDS